MVDTKAAMVNKAAMDNNNMVDIKDLLLLKHPNSIKPLLHNNMVDIVVDLNKHTLLNKTMVRTSYTVFALCAIFAEFCYYLFHLLGRPSGPPGGPPPGADPQLWNWFTAVDADHSGQLSVDELQRALVNGDWSPFNIETVRTMVNMFDKGKKKNQLGCCG